MAVALFLVSIALAITLGLLLFGTRSTAAGADALQLQAEIKARQQAEAELERRRKDFEDQKQQLAEARDQLKQTKRKLFEQKETEKGGRDLARAREEVERHASVQLEVVRTELSAALAEVERLKSEIAGKNRRIPVPDKPEPILEPPPASVEPKRRFRELSDAEREKIERLEHEAIKERSRAQDLDREVRRMKGRTETQNRVYLVVKGELDLIKDKFKALEKRLNRTLLENDLLRRAIRDLEKKSGIAAERTELTQDEIAASDRRVEERALAEAVEAETRRKRHAEDGAEKTDPAGVQLPPQNGLPPASSPEAPAQDPTEPAAEPV